MDTRRLTVVALNGDGVVKHPNTELKAEIEAIIEASTNVSDTVKRLRAAGFKIERKLP